MERHCGHCGEELEECEMCGRLHCPSCYYEDDWEPTTDTEVGNQGESFTPGSE
jgi:hypothetical protein